MMQDRSAELRLRSTARYPERGRVGRSLLACVLVFAFGFASPMLFASSSALAEASVQEAASGNASETGEFVPRAAGPAGRKKNQAATDKKKTTRPEKSAAGPPGTGPPPPSSAPPPKTTPEIGAIRPSGSMPPTRVEPSRADQGASNPPPPREATQTGDARDSRESAARLPKKTLSAGSAPNPAIPASAGDVAYPKLSLAQRQRLRQAPEVERSIDFGDGVLWDVTAELASGQFGTTFELRDRASGKPLVLKHSDADHIQEEANGYRDGARKRAQYRTLPRFDEGYVAELMEREVALQNRVAGRSERFVRAEQVGGNQILMPIAGDRGFRQGADQLTAAVLKEKITRQEFRGAVRRIASDMVEALDALDAEGITHRDLHSGNVRLDAEGRVTLLDFGSALDRDETVLVGLSKGIATPNGGHVNDQLNPSDSYAVGKLLRDFTKGPVGTNQRLLGALGDDFKNFVRQLESLVPTPGNNDYRKGLDSLAEHPFMKAKDGEKPVLIGKVMETATETFDQPGYFLPSELPAQN